MSQKFINSRITHKHDLEVNWNKAINFIPLEGELIIYDADENFNYPRIKYGDGKTVVTELPFYTKSVDWNQQNSSEIDFLKNKPFQAELITKKFVDNKELTIASVLDFAGIVCEDTALSLTLGEKYKVDFTVTLNTGEVVPYSFEDVECVDCSTLFGFSEVCPGIVISPSYFIKGLGSVASSLTFTNSLSELTFLYINNIGNNVYDETKSVYFAAQVDTSFNSNIDIAMAVTVSQEELNASIEAAYERLLQADWKQMDKTKHDYIQNKPFGEEVILTPKNEIYFEDNYKIISDGQVWYQFNHNLGTVSNATYSLDVYNGANKLDTFDGTAVGPADFPELADILPEGCYALLGQSGNTIYLLGIDNCIMDPQTGGFTYSNSHFVGFPYNDDTTHIILNGLNTGSYSRVSTRKIPNKYLDIKVDHTFEATSVNPQSGLAVKDAIDKFKAKLPESFACEISVPIVLGDQHIKLASTPEISPDNTQCGLNYQIYTEGIGFNKDLNTTSKDTLVDAINEVQANTDATHQKLASSLKLDNGVTIYNPKTDTIELKMLTTDLLDVGEAPSIVYQRYIANDYTGKNEVLYASIYNGVVAFDTNTRKLTLLNEQGITDLFTVSQVFMADEIVEEINSNNYYSKFIITYSILTEHYNYYIITQNRLAGSSYRQQKLYHLFPDGGASASTINYGDSGWYDLNNRKDIAVLDKDSMLYSEQGFVRDGNSVNHTIFKYVLDEYDYISVQEAVSIRLYTSGSLFIYSHLSALASEGKMIYAYPKGHDSNVWVFNIDGTSYSYQNEQNKYNSTNRSVGFTVYKDNIITISGPSYDRPFIQIRNINTGELIESKQLVADPGSIPGEHFKEIFCFNNTLYLIGYEHILAYDMTSNLDTYQICSWSDIYDTIVIKSPVKFINDTLYLISYTSLYAIPLRKSWTTEDQHIEYIFDGGNAPIE